MQICVVLKNLQKSDKEYICTAIYTLFVIFVIVFTITEIDKPYDNYI